jgi:hypothetical protein
MIDNADLLRIVFWILIAALVGWVWSDIMFRLTH